jgi:3-hydroxyacyl-CoA dehydrogenase
VGRRPLGFAKRTFRKVGVLGAGLMGGGIALVTARAGLDVVLLDVSQAAAERGLSETTTTGRSCDSHRPDRSTSRTCSVGAHCRH